MTTDRDMDRLLGRWLETGPDTAPDRMLDILADRIGRQPQHPAWRLDRRLLAMNPYIKVGAAIAAVLIVAIVGWNLLPARQGVGLPAPSASPAPSPTPSTNASAAPLPNPEADLAPGRFFALAGPHRVAFTVPEGWRLTEKGSYGLAFVPVGGPDGDTVRVFYDMRPASRDPGCPEIPEQQGSRDIGSSGNLIDQVASTPGVVATVQKVVPVGSTQGIMTDVSLDPAWTRSCPFSDGQPTVPLIVDTITDEAGPFWGLGPREKERLVAFDVEGWSNVVIVIDSIDGTTFESLVQQAMPFVRSLEVT